MINLSSMCIFRYSLASLSISSCLNQCSVVCHHHKKVFCFSDSLKKKKKMMVNTTLGLKHPHKKIKNTLSISLRHSLTSTICIKIYTKRKKKKKKEMCHHRCFPLSKWSISQSNGYVHVLLHPFPRWKRPVDLVDLISWKKKKVFCF